MPPSSHALSQGAQGELDRLLQSGLRAAEAELVRVAEFVPFVHTIDAQGRMLAAGFDLSALGKHPEPEAVIAHVTAALRAARDQLRAVAIVMNSTLQSPRIDVIEQRLEHVEGVSLTVLTRYKRPKFGGALEYGDTRSFAKPAEIWG